MSFKQYTLPYKESIQALLYNNLSFNRGADYYTHAVKSIILTNKELTENEQEYLRSKLIALFDYYTEPYQLAELFSKWYVEREGPNVFEEYPVLFKNLIDFLLTNNDIFISNSVEIQRNQLETLLNGNY